MCKIQFRNEDCLKTIETIQKGGKKIDLVLTSPPYNGSRNSGKKTEHSRETHNDRYDVYEDNKTNEECYKWLISIINGCDSILNKNGVILWNQSYSSENPMVLWEFINKIHTETDFMIADVIVWKKGSALPNNVSYNRLTRIWEPVFILCRKEEYKTFNANKKVTSTSKTGQKYYENVFNFFTAPNNDGSNNLNKATFSSDMVLQLLHIYAKPNSVIYDPFMGTGTTGIGVEKYGNGCICVGSEISTAQVEYSYKRLEEYRNKHRQEDNKC